MRYENLSRKWAWNSEWMKKTSRSERSFLVDLIYVGLPIYDSHTSGKAQQNVVIHSYLCVAPLGHWLQIWDSVVNRMLFVLTIFIHSSVSPAAVTRVRHLSPLYLPFSVGVQRHPSLQNFLAHAQEVHPLPAAWWLYLWVWTALAVFKFYI